MHNAKDNRLRLEMNEWQPESTDLFSIVVYPQVIGVICESLLNSINCAWNIGIFQCRDDNWHLEGIGWWKKSGSKKELR